MRQQLQDSLVLVHGGMAQNVGPILEMVTEKYLLRSEAEWKARQRGHRRSGRNPGCARSRTMSPAIGAATTRNFTGRIQTIIPWASNLYTETLIEQARREFGKDFWGFWMLGGMSGGGMGFIFAPERKAEAQERLQEIMSDTKRELQHALPFAMEPVVYDFAINETGTFAELLTGRGSLDAARLLRADRSRPAAARMRARSRRCAAPSWTNSAPPAAPSPNCAAWSRRFSTRCCRRGKARRRGAKRWPRCWTKTDSTAPNTNRSAPTCGAAESAWRRTGLPASTSIEDVEPEDVVDATAS